METKEIRTKSASELSEEIYQLDIRNLEVREKITELNNTIHDIEAIVENGIAENKELKNERERKSETNKQLAGNITHKHSKETKNTLEIQLKTQENNKKYLERELKIVLAQDQELGKELTDISLEIRKGDKERGKLQDRLEAIKVEQGEEQKKLSGIVVKTSEEFRVEQEKKEAEQMKNIKEHGLVAEVIRKERTQEEIQKQFAELIKNSEPLKKLAKEIKDIQETLRDSMADREYYQRKIFIKAIERGIRV